MTIKEKAIICDLDGTLCNATHRLRFIDKNNMNKFHEESIHDRPYPQVKELIEKFYNDGYVIIFLTARNKKYEKITQEWLEKYISQAIPNYILIMNEYKKEVFTSSEFKESRLKFLLKNYDIFFAIDDRKKHVDVFRKNGVLCFSVGEDEEKTNLYTYIDPPSGHRYGFPKKFLTSCTPSNSRGFLLENGYPKEAIDNLGDHFTCRFWHSGG